MVDSLIALLRKANLDTFRLDKDLVLRALLLCRPSGRVSLCRCPRLGGCPLTGSSGRLFIGPAIPKRGHHSPALTSHHPLLATQTPTERPLRHPGVPGRDPAATTYRTPPKPPLPPSQTECTQPPRPHPRPLFSRGGVPDPPVFRATPAPGNQPSQAVPGTPSPQLSFRAQRSGAEESRLLRLPVPPHPPHHPQTNRRRLIHEHNVHPRRPDWRHAPLAPRNPPPATSNATRIGPTTHPSTHPGAS